MRFANFCEEKQSVFKVGVVGYSDKKFDIEEAVKLINKAFDEIESKHPNKKFDCVSGLTNLGIPKLAYEQAVKRGWKTTGIACEKASNYELFPVDKKIISGKEWGDESPVFLGTIDALIRIGGGKQSHAEAAEAKVGGLEVIEFDLKEK